MIPKIQITSLRNIDKLALIVPKETIERLKGFMGLDTQEEIEKWHQFCHESPFKVVQGKPVAF